MSIYNSVQFLQDLAVLFFNGAALAIGVIAVAFIVYVAASVGVDFIKLLFGRLD